MRIALLQEERYLPSYHGSNKSNRSLLEALAEEGDDCLAFATVLLRDTTLEQLAQDMSGRGITIRQIAPGQVAYSYRGVEVRGIPRVEAHAERSQFLIDELRRFRPDITLVSSSRDLYLLRSALLAESGRVIYLAHGHHDLPFGPDSMCPDEEKHELLRSAAAVVAISRYERDYIARYGGIEAVRLRFPVYGPGPFPKLASFDTGRVAMLKSSRTKGVDIFLGLARLFPQVQFAASRWDASPETIAQIESTPNVELWEPAEDLDELLRRTRILLLPSLVPETFGLLATEAMLRGIPVLASRLGGLPEATHGVGELISVRPAQPIPGKGYSFPEPDLDLWREGLERLISDRSTYERISSESRSAATSFVSRITVQPFQELFQNLSSRARSSSARSEKCVVAVVDPFDAGYLLAEEIVHGGHKIEAVISGKNIDPAIVAKCDPAFFHSMVSFDDDVATTAASLRDRGVRCVLAGCETGVNVADALSEALGLVTNGTPKSAARRNKFLMAESAAGHGVPIPRQYYSSFVNEIVAWARRFANWPVVVKPPESLASDDVRLCRNETDIRNAFAQTVGRRNIAGVMNHGLIVQELMDATQYVVDTVSLDGQHYLSGIWRYGRPHFAPDVLQALRTGRELPDIARRVGWSALAYGAISSVSKELLPGNDELAETLFEYAQRVLDALGIRIGPAHFELMQTEVGVRLVEVGARVHGAGQTHMMNRICTGADQVQQTIDVYLNPERFRRSAGRFYALRQRSMMVRLTPWRRGTLRGFVGLERIRALRSFHDTFVMAEPGRRAPGCVGVVILLHPEEEQMRRDHDTIRELEQQDLYAIEDDLKEVAFGAAS